MTDKEKNDMVFGMQQMLGVSEARAIDLIRGWEILEGRPEIKQKFCLHCAVTGDPRWFFVLWHDSPQDIVERYVRTMPEEAEQFRKEFNDYKAVLDDPMGFSQARLSKLHTMVPTNLWRSLTEFDREFWHTPASVRGFLEAFPSFAGKA